MTTTPLMKRLFSISFILVILFLASQSFQLSSARELEKSPGTAVDNKWDNTVSGSSDLKDIDVVSKKSDKKKKKKKKKKNAAHGLMQKRVSPFQVFAFVGYFVFFGFLLF